MKHSNEPAAIPAPQSTWTAATEPVGEIKRACPGIRLLIHSSERLPWSGLSLERRSHGSGTWNAPPLDGHMLCLYLGPGMQLDQRRSLGMPPYAYVLRRRIERVQQLLLDGMPIAEAALSVGFCDQGHLTRHMRRVQGLTPTELLARRKPRG